MFTNIAPAAALGPLPLPCLAGIWESWDYEVGAPERMKGLVSMV